MQTRAKIFDDLAKVAGGAASTLSGLKGEVENLVRHQIERLLRDADMVPRDEFDAVKAVAAKARTEQEALEKRVRELEKKLGIKAPVKAKAKVKPQAKTKAKTKPGAKPKAKKAPAKNKSKK
ncbi:MAG: accessory factor UbiK family protein [Rhodospirillales bacterium]|nr:accessory factor UbiK family protein [Alphaproteobacteria bacterium]MBL6947602.1 accessory factor UbiK family protein [Rhodospirillales bacterium]